MMQRLAWSLMIFTCGLEVFNSWNRQAYRAQRLASQTSVQETEYVPPSDQYQDLEAQESADFVVNPKPPQPKRQAPAVLSIEYCQTCSYKSLVEEISNRYIEHELEFTHPHITVIESEYPLDFPWNVISQIVCMILLVGGDWVFQTLGIVPPPIYYRAKENKIMAFVLVFFVSNYITSALTNTGAFEVAYGGKQIYSKLARRRLPAVVEIVSLIDAFRL